MRNLNNNRKRKILYMFCDIRGTITKENNFFEIGTPNDFVLMCENLIQIRRLKNCEQVYFSFCSSEDCEEVVKILKEVGPILKSYGIEVVNSVSDNAIISFQNSDFHKPIIKENKYKFKYDVVLEAFKQNKENEANVEYSFLVADDSLLNRIILGAWKKSEIDVEVVNPNHIDDNGFKVNGIIGLNSDLLKIINSLRKEANNKEKTQSFGI